MSLLTRLEIVHLFCLGNITLSSVDLMVLGLVVSFAFARVPFKLMLVPVAGFTVYVAGFTVLVPFSTLCQTSGTVFASLFVAAANFGVKTS
jgi:hypothetical protein